MTAWSRRPSPTATRAAWARWRWPASPLSKAFARSAIRTGRQPAISGVALVNQAGNGPLGTVRSGTLEAANIDLTEELVALIAAQRNFQANAQAIETANNMTQTIVNLQV